MSKRSRDEDDEIENDRLPSSTYTISNLSLKIQSLLLPRYCDYDNCECFDMFTSYEAYQTHYEMFHMNRCIECDVGFPSNHLLELHIEEVHDVFWKIKKELGKPNCHRCFNEFCQLMFQTEEERIRHMLDQGPKGHGYPLGAIDFQLVKHGIKEQTTTF